MGVSEVFFFQIHNEPVQWKKCLTLCHCLATLRGGKLEVLLDCGTNDNNTKCIPFNLGLKVIILLDSEEEKGDTGYQVKPKGEKGDEGNISYLGYKGEVETLALLNRVGVLREELAVQDLK